MPYGTHFSITQDPDSGPPHSSFRWLWADETARLAETDVLQHDVDTATTGLVLSTGVIWRATATTPTWVSVGAGFGGDGDLTVEVRDAVNDDSSIALRVSHNVTNVAGDGIGTVIEFQAETTAGGEDTPIAQIIATVYDQALDEAEISIYVRDDGSVSKRVFNANGEPAAEYVAVGANAVAAGPGRSAFGPGSLSAADDSTALGADSESRIVGTANLAGPLITRKDEGETDYFRLFAGAEVTIFGPDVDLESVADYTVTLPAGCHFWIDEIGVVCTVLSGLITQPTIRFGITGTLAKHHAAAITTLLTAAFKREKFAPLVPEDGETSLTAGVTVAGAATTLFGRFYWKGILVEDE